MRSGVDLCRFNPIQILLKAGGVVDINKILCCSTLLFMLFTSEYESDILIIIDALAILPDYRSGVRLRSLGHEAEVQLIHLAHMRLRELNKWMILGSLMIILVESLLVLHLRCLYLMMISHPVR
jgi:hypothetical protein